MIDVGVVGSRLYGDEIAVRAIVYAMPVAFYPREFRVISGGAKGVDTWAIDEAEVLGLNTLVLKADWAKGKHAGILRNMLLVDRCDFLFIFWDGKSPGTKHVISYAKKQGVPYRIIGEGDVWLNIK